MHRIARCLFLLCAALLGFPAFVPPAVAQDAPAPAAHSRTHLHPKTHAGRPHRPHRHTTTGETSPSGSSPAETSAPATRMDVRLRLGDGVRTWHPTRRQIGVSYAPGYDKSSPSGHIRFVVDRAKLRHYLAGIAPYVRRSPRSARVVVADPSTGDMGEGQVPARIVPGQDGARLDVDAAVDGVQKAIQSDAATQHIVLPLKITAARVQTAQLKGVNARIGYFVTRFNPGDTGRTQTVRRAISLIDGTVVPPDGVFSINKNVGERTPARGFGKGHVFINNHMEIQVGGGMCQVATTLFNAVMLADLKVLERHQHVRTVPYIEPGRDATVYYGQKDFRFQNDTGAPVYVSYKTTRSRAVVSLFGKAVPGRKVRLVGHYRRLGERHYTGVFYRVVYRPDGTKQKDPPFYSGYKWPSTLDYSR